jgi:hypothetical protein
MNYPTNDYYIFGYMQCIISIKKKGGLFMPDIKFEIVKKIGILTNLRRASPLRWRPSPEGDLRDGAPLQGSPLSSGGDAARSALAESFERWADHEQGSKKTPARSVCSLLTNTFSLKRITGFIC